MSSFRVREKNLLLYAAGLFLLTRLLITGVSEITTSHSHNYLLSAIQDFL